MCEVLSEVKKKLEFTLPAQPELLLELQKEVSKDDVSLERVAKLVSTDAAVSAEILKTINSAFFGMKVKVSSIPQAVSLMGLSKTINLVNGFALKEVMGEGEFSFPRYWDSAKNTAILCAFVANKLSLHEPSESYSLGLFHDVGIPLMAKRFPGYLDVLKKSNTIESALTTDLEDATYNTNHAVMGYYLCREWGLSENLRQVISRHHDCGSLFTQSNSSTETVSALMAILKLAEWGHEVYRTGDSTLDWCQFGSLILEYLSLSEEDSLDLLEEMKEVLLDANCN